MTLIIGNTIALVASILIVIVSYAKTKKSIMIIQTIQVLLLTLSNLILGGITGAIINGITVVRNLLCYKNKLNNFTIAIIAILLTTITLLFNNSSILGLLPLISTLAYTIFINTKSTIFLKLLILLNLVCWGIYDFFIMSYTSAIIQAIGVVVCLISIWQLICSQKKSPKLFTSKLSKGKVLEATQ